MIHKVFYEVDPMVCPRCGGKMKVIAFITDYAVVDRIIDHLKLTFVADKPPPSHLAFQQVLVAAETPERSRNPERINFIVFDSMFSSNFGVKRSREIASKIVANAPAGDSFGLLVNSPREGLKLIFGPEGDKEALLKEIKKAKLYPGADWFKDTFSSRDSFLERFTAESDYNANQYADPLRVPQETGLDYRKQYIQEVRRFSEEADQIGSAFQNCHDENLHLYTPQLMIEKTHDQMAADQKKMFAWDIATEGFLSQMAGRTEKADDRKTITTTKEKLYQCTIDVIIPVEMQNHMELFSYFSFLTK